MNPIHLINSIPSIRNLIGRSLSRPGLFVVALTLAGITLSTPARAGCNLGCDVSNNVFLGDNALGQNTTGFDNAAVGRNALAANTTGQLGVAVGSFALQSNTTGIHNTAVGGFSLNHNTTGSDNTATGISALNMNTSGLSNTASGAFALTSNTTGNLNTANGASALYNNTTGLSNTASGANALLANSTGSNNTANGASALFNATGNNNTATGVNTLTGQFPGSGSNNTATGVSALFSNTTGSFNAANGINALFSNTTGNYNAANGSSALYRNTTGGYNTAYGVNALYRNTTGNSNIALGVSAGAFLTTGDNNIDIGNGGVANESGRIRIGTQGKQINCYIAGISGVGVPGGVGVMVDVNGRLGTVVSSKRFKDEIKPMEEASESILSLKPVTFRYKHELDPKGIAQFGLVAEEVEKVNPDLVARDENGKVYTVRYEAVNAMLLNEFLKEHQRVEELEAAATQQQKEIGALTQALKEQAAQIRQVRAEVAVQNARGRAVAEK